MPMPTTHLHRNYRTPYHVWVRRGWRPTEVEVYRVSLRERLPVIRIPLRKTDKDVPLDLQSLIQQCYCNGAYDQDIDYQADPEPPLDPADGRWADALLRKAGRRRQGRRPARKRRP